MQGYTVQSTISSSTSTLHVSPVKPETQWHIYPVVVLVQVALFSHGSELQYAGPSQLRPV